MSNLILIRLYLGITIISSAIIPPFLWLNSWISVSLLLFVTYLSLFLTINVFLAFTVIGVTTVYCCSLSLSTVDIFIRFLPSFSVKGIAKKPSGIMASLVTSIPNSCMRWNNRSLAAWVGAPGGFILILSMVIIIGNMQ